MTKIISWNVNGLRAVVRKGDWKFFEKSGADIFCIQETKSEPEQLTDETRNPKGYHSAFSWSKVKKGYSGVAVFSKVKPLRVIDGLGVKEFDDEGRLLEVHFDDFVLWNVYFPNGGGGPHRVDYKLRFYDAFLERIDAIRKTKKPIIFCGDVNTAHEAIDLARPKENEKNTGFLPEERAWLDEVVSHGYVDIFRRLHPNKVGAYSYWDMKTAARERNVGWRIDYFFVSPDLVPKVKECRILSDVYGSDHCPVELTVI
jgi:exodeoxyribonuclease-3